MSHINDNFHSIAAAWEINERLIYHMQKGQMLEGLKFDVEGTLKVDGQDNLPLLQPWGVSISETIFPGASRKSTGFSLPGAAGNTPIIETLTLGYKIGTARKYGFFRRDPTDASARKGLLEWLSLIRDAVETEATVDKAIDSRFRLASARPVKFSVTEPETSQLAFWCVLEISLDLQPYCRGERSHPFMPII